jgi:uncharacterized protein (TIGR03435 family)
MAELSLVVKATLVLALALCATRLAVRASAAVRSLMLACAFGLLAILPVISFTLPARTIEIPAAYSAPFASASLPTATPVTGSRVTAALPQAPGVPYARYSWRVVLLAGWTLGAAGFAAPLVLGLFRLRRLRTRGRAWSHPSLPASVDLLLHDELRVPMTYGGLRPVIVLPHDAHQWSGSDLRRALLHELEHARRRDWPVHLAARAVCALYWFHPLVWIAWRRLCLEAERACDDVVLREENGADYAAQLVLLARRITRHDALPLLSIAGRSHLSTRVAAMLASDVTRGPVGATAAVTVVTLAAIAALVVGPLQAVTSVQRPAGSSDPAFETTTIRPSAPSERCCIVRYGADGRMSASNVDLVDLIVSAYNVYWWQVDGAPEWAGSNGLAPRDGGDRYDVQATAPRSASPDDMRQMLKTLLVDRFRLTVRQETRTRTVYELVVEPTGHRLQPPGARAYAAADDIWLRVEPPPSLMAMLDVDQMTMPQLARNLGGILLTTVIDRTGLAGVHRVQARWDANPNRRDVLQQPTGSSPRDPERPTIFEAFPEQLGLRLRETTGAVDYLVIDRADRIK